MALLKITEYLDDVFTEKNKVVTQSGDVYINKDNISFIKSTITTKQQLPKSTDDNPTAKPEFVTKYMTTVVMNSGHRFVLFSDEDISSSLG